MTFLFTFAVRTIRVNDMERKKIVINYTDYASMRKGLQSVAGQFNKEDKIGIPYLIGCCRGGGDWDIVLSMIEEIFDGYNVTFYKYKG